jgi:nicotinamide-nucleotide amidase
MDLQQLSEQVGQCLLRDKLILVTAESCTGGWISQCITDISGSSQWFDRGFVTYSNQAKRDMLGVTAETLEKYGAVSEQTVIEMVQGALRNSPADVAVAVSGVAGPGGGSLEKPVGLVWHAWATTSAATLTTEHAKPITLSEQYLGNRQQIREQTVKCALDGILRLLG